MAPSPKPPKGGAVSFRGSWLVEAVTVEVNHLIRSENPRALSAHRSDGLGLRSGPPHRGVDRIYPYNQRLVYSGIDRLAVDPCGLK
jgi:hypothetical protein